MSTTLSLPLAGTPGIRLSPPGARLDRSDASASRRLAGEGRGGGATRSALSMTTEIAALWRSLLRDLFEPYRPERHYMRGPGPKWRAKHGRGGPH